MVIATVATIVVLAILTLWLIAIAPRDPERRRRFTGIAAALFGFAATAVAASYLAAATDEVATSAPAAAFLFTIGGAAFLAAPVAAFIAFFREEGRLAAAAIGLTLLVPALAGAWLFACMVTDGCFH